jgi:hypothetical protein
MSMELRLILAYNHGAYFGTDALYVTDELSLDQNYRLFGHIDNEHMAEKGVKQVCKPKPIPPAFKVMVLDEESGWKEEAETPYGDRLTYVVARELAKIKSEIWDTPWNRAILAMIKALPEDFPIILWWH